MKLAVLDTKGNETGREAELSETVFGIAPNEYAIYLDVKQHLANKRQGTHKAKERGDIKGSTRKLRKQKGSGAARVGSIKSPIFRGGGRVFGPRPRNYGFKLNKRLKRLARRSALSTQFKLGNILVVEDFVFEKPCTKDFINLLSTLNLKDKKVVFVLGSSKKNVYLSSRNLQDVSVLTLSELNTYAILNVAKVVFLEDVLPQVEINLNKSSL